MKNNHTKGTWSVQTFGNKQVSIFTDVKDEDINAFRSFITIEHFNVEDVERNEANAEHICLCVNKHKELVEAVALAMEHINQFPFKTTEQDRQLEIFEKALEGIDIYETLND